MPIPATSGQFRTNRSDMQIGDYAAVKYTAAAGAIGAFSDFGAPLETAQANEIPITGTNTPNGYCYLIKADKGLLIPDRVIQTNISYETLSANDFIWGKLGGIGAIIPTMTSATTPAPFIVTTTGQYNSNYAAYMVFDKAATGWLTASTTIGEVMVDLGAIYNAGSYSITNVVSGDGGTHAGAWEIYGSTQDVPVDWTLLHSVENWTSQNPSIFDFPISLLRHLKIRLTAKNNAFYPWNGLGEFQLFGSNTFFIRSMTGGVGYLDGTGNCSGTDSGLGMWPIINEWDKYIRGSNLDGKITAGDDDVWHWSNCYSFCQDTVSTKIASGSFNKVARGKTSPNGMLSCAPTTAYSTVGFRPYLRYLEADSKAKTYWY